MLGDEQRRAASASCRERLADQARPGRVELGRRLVEDHVARPHREQRRDPDELGLAARQPRRVASWIEARVWSSAIAARVRSTVSATSRPRFIGPSATSSKTVAAMPGPLRVRVLEPDDDPLASSCVAPAGHRLAVDRQRPGQRAADRRRRETGGDEAERRLARLVRPDQPDDLAVAQRQVDLVEHRRWRSPA